MLRLNGVEIEDTFAEAFKMRAARVIVTAETAGWARTAAALATGYATSVIGCDAEAGIEADAAGGGRRPTAGPASACWSSGSTPRRSARRSSTASASA